MKEAYPPTPPPRTSPAFSSASTSGASSEDEGVLDCGGLPPLDEEQVLTVPSNILELLSKVP